MTQSRQFENQVQLVKYEVLKEVSQLTFDNTLEELYVRIPNRVDPGPEPRFRCCIHHERAVTKERIRMAMGGTSAISNIVEVLDSACEQCPVNRYNVTESCMGCLAHRCQSVCPVNAIQIVAGKAEIDHATCIECGKCHEACPYNAIVDIMRPCKKACPVDAISFNKEKRAVIDNNTCIECGACVYQCPFGAIQDKSEIVPVIRHLMTAQKPDAPQVYAVVAPAIAAQFSYASIGQVVSGIKALGFKDVIEAALGADLVTLHEAKELAEHLAHASDNPHAFMTSSCCPAFVNFIEKKHPQLVENISTTVSPMVATARLIKSIDPKAIVVFIGPCIAKKVEKNSAHAKDAVDYVLTFEELVALIDSKAIQLEHLPESPLDNASYFGRIFASIGGLSEAVMDMAQKMNLDIQVKAVPGDGIKACDKLLKLAKAKRLDANFIEGMACVGGCIKGPVTMHHGIKDKKAIEVYAKMALEPDALTAARVFDPSSISLSKE